MTHSNDLYLAVEQPRRKELRTFIHELKKFVGGKLHLHVSETLGQSSDDKLEIRLFPLNCIHSAFENAKVYTDIVQMCDEYGIPRRNVSQVIDEETHEPVVTIKLYVDFVL
jgi:uncharacterized metal-binding protein